MHGLYSAGEGGSLMSADSYTYKVRLFYSYCHRDSQHREKLEKTLNMLKENDLINEWHDGKITAGSELQPKIIENLKKSDIVLFLVSSDFLASEACKKEWALAKQEGKKLIPIIIEDCPWPDFDGMRDFLALPTDGEPIENWSPVAPAWTSVYEGIKSAVKEFLSTFELKPAYKEEMGRVEFISQNQKNIQIKDIFVFPNISKITGEEEKPIKKMADLAKLKYAIIRGQELSGKTTLLKMLFTNFIAKGKPVLLVNLESARGSMNRVFQKEYSEQFSGDYNLWMKQSGKIIILDNLNHNHLPFIRFAQDNGFEKIFASTPSDRYNSYFRDETKLVDFEEVKINQMKMSQQEELIRKWKALGAQPTGKLSDGVIDNLERNVNSIIIHNKIVPRYPFFILSILQTYEAGMPRDLRITAYGHCYQALIVANLLRVGIDKSEIDTCFNFLSRLAYAIYGSQSERHSIDKSEYQQFNESYKEDYISVKQSVRNRLFNPYGPLEEKDGEIYFSWRYEYYFFLGYYLSANYEDSAGIINDMAKNSYLKDNSFSLIFIIHHSNDQTIIDKILEHTKNTFKKIDPARFSIKEVEMFTDLMQEIPKKIISDKSIQEERQNLRDQLDDGEGDIETITESPYEDINDIYRAFKNLEILSQILKNKYGSMPKGRIFEITETIADTGLRMISMVLSFDLKDIAAYLLEKMDKEEIRNLGEQKQIDIITRILGAFLFMTTMGIIEKIVDSMNKPEIKEILDNMCAQKDTPAYDLIHSFYSIDVADEFSGVHQTLISKMLTKHRKNKILRRVLSLRMQHYINTHKIREPRKQSLLSLLGIRN